MSFVDDRENEEMEYSNLVDKNCEWQEALSKPFTQVELNDFIHDLDLSKLL